MVHKWPFEGNHRADVALVENELDIPVLLFRLLQLRSRSYDWWDKTMINIAFVGNYERCFTGQRGRSIGNTLMHVAIPLQN